MLNLDILANMINIISECGINFVSDLDERNKYELKIEKKLLGIDPQVIFCFYQALSLERQLRLELKRIETFSFSSANGKYYFTLKKDSDEYVLCGKSEGSVDFVIKHIFGEFDRKNKIAIDKAISDEQIAFINYYMAQQYGIKKIEKQIEEAEVKSIDLIKEQFSGLHLNYERACELKFVFDMTMGRSKYENCEIMLYVMSVYSFIEHAAILVLPFWFAMREEEPLWNDFCHGFSYSEFDTFKDFWTTKEPWIDSFIGTLCRFHRNSYDKPNGRFVDATEEEKSLKELYERLRKDFRNPIHHGLSTGEFRTGISAEVPSLKNKVNFNAPPLMREIGIKTFYDTKKLLNLFLSVLKKRNPQIVEYLESELNVPVDCSELKEYVLNGDMQDFLKQYEQLEAHASELM